MKKIFTFAVLLLFVMAGRAATTITNQTLTDMTITLSDTLVQNTDWGYYVDGNVWIVVAGSDRTVTAKTPAQTTAGGGETINGHMVNPTMTTAQRYDQRMKSSSFSAPSSLPLTMSTNEVLITADSIADPAGDDVYQDHPVVNAYAVWVFVDSAPSSGAFRPMPFANHGEANAMDSLWTTNNVNFDAFADLPTANITGEYPWATVEGIGQSFIYEGDTEWNGRYKHSLHGMSGSMGSSSVSPRTYGREMAQYANAAVMKLNLNYTDAEKEATAYHIIQYGLDILEIVKEGKALGHDSTTDRAYKWVSDGGHNIGRMAPAIAAAMALGDATYKSYLAPLNSSTEWTTVREYFAELGHTFEVTQEDVDTAHTACCGRSYLDYVAADIGKPEYGQQHDDGGDRVYDSDVWFETYRATCGASIASTAVIARVMGAHTHIGADDALFGYADRHMDYMESLLNDAYDGDINYGDIVSGDGSTTRNTIADPFYRYNMPDFHQTFFAEYRATFGPPAGGGDVTAPTLSSELASTISNDSATLSWLLSETVSTNGFQIDTSATFAGTPYAGTNTATTGTTPSFAVTNLAANTTYYWRGYSTDDAGNTGTGATNSFITLANAKAATPTFDVADGDYVEEKTVTISTVTSGATIYYTTDLSTPTTNSMVYSSPLTVSGTTTIKAFAAKAGNSDSDVAQGAFYLGSWEASDVWYNIGFAERTTDFDFYVSVRATSTNTDTVFAIGDTANRSTPNVYDDYPILVRFFTNGEIQARNGGIYTNDTSAPYVADTDYLIRINPDVSAFTYDVYVGGVLIANDYAYRTTQSAENTFNYFGFVNPWSEEQGLNEARVNFGSFSITSNQPARTGKRRGRDGGASAAAMVR